MEILNLGGGGVNEISQIRLIKCFGGGIQFEEGENKDNPPPPFLPEESKYETLHKIIAELFILTNLSCFTIENSMFYEDI